MTGRRELWEVPRYATQRRSFQPQCDCYRTDDPQALHLLVKLPAETREALRFVLVDSIGQVLDVAFSPTAARTNGRVRPAAARR